MGLSVTMCTLLAGLGGFAGWTLSLRCASEGPMQVPKDRSLTVGDQPLEFNTHLHVRIPIHSRQLLHDLLSRFLVYLNE